MTEMIFVTEELYGCSCCNKKEKVIVLYPYYDTPLAPYCASCFVNKMRLVIEGYSKVVKIYSKVSENIEVFNYR